VISQLIGRAPWWIVLYFIPFVNLIIGILDCIEVAKRFDKGAGWGVGLALLGFIFAPLLGFQDENKWRSA